jgi:protoheme IX farnesyltransferase
VSTSNQLPQAQALAVTHTTPYSQAKSRLGEYVTLSKPKIAVMVMVTVGVGFTIGTLNNFDGWLFLHALCGIGLTALASSALNQLMEHDTDGLMLRTQWRPLPTRKLTLTEAAVFGFFAGITGGLWLYYYVNPLTAYLAILTLILYVGVYTPLKRITPWCTAIGAIPGAMPPLLGYCGATGQLDMMGLALFLWLFIWQFPHFLAIAWMYQEQYTSAGLKMLPANAAHTNTVGNIAVIFAWLMIPASIFISFVGEVGFECGVIGTLLSLIYVWYSYLFRKSPTRTSARKVLLYSVMFLPIMLFLMMFSHWRVS